MELDVPYKTGAATLCQLIMSIMSTMYPESPLFHNVSLNYCDDGHIFKCLPPLEDQETIMIHTLLPYLCHYVGADVEAYFTTDCIERCEGLTYDE